MASCGYPACAGIDLVLGCNESQMARLPRMRGDRPWATEVRPGAVMATPHARGSTPRRYQATGDLYGYPACAGIDLIPAHLSIEYEGLPRMRGDRPDGHVRC